MTTILVIGSADDQSLPAPFLELAIAAERTVRAELETRGCEVRFVDTAHPPFPDIADALSGAAALLLLGGGDLDPTLYGQPADLPKLYGVDRTVDEYAIAAVRAAEARSLPVFGICRGAQVINVAHGGSLIPDIADWGLHHGPDPTTIFVPEPITVEAGSRLAALLDTERLTVQSGHHQAVDRVGSGLRATAYADDGIVEGIESASPGEWIVGIQWHPEHAAAPPADRTRLFDAFVAQAQSRTPQGAQQ